MAQDSVENNQDDGPLTMSKLQPPKRVLCGLIRLNKGVKLRNYLASLTHALLLGFFLSGVELLQQNILVSSDYYNYGPADAIKYNALITLEDLLVKLTVTSAYGIMVDKLGRQKSTIIGYWLIGGSLLLFPLRFYSPFFDNIGWYFGARFLYSNGSAIIPIIPLIADYVDDQSLGRAIGFNVLLMTVGFTTSTLIIKYMQIYNLFYTCLVFAVFIFVVGNAYALFLRPGNTYYKKSVVNVNLENSQANVSKAPSNMLNSSRMGKRWLIKNDCQTKPWIVVGYIFAFLNGIGLATTSQLLNLFVESFGDPDARGRGATVVFQANVASFFTSLLFGPMLDCIKPLYIAIIAFAVNILGYCNIWFVHSPNDSSLSLTAVSVGVGYACSQLLTNFLGFKNYRKSIRGLLFAIANICIVAGVILIAVIGGCLLIFVNRNWPFYIASGCSILSLLFFVYYYCTKILRASDESEEPLIGRVSEGALDPSPTNGGSDKKSVF
jgi:hypothetical protein